MDQLRDELIVLTEPGQCRLFNRQELVSLEIHGSHALMVLETDPCEVWFCVQDRDNRWRLVKRQGLTHRVERLTLLSTTRSTLALIREGSYGDHSNLHVFNWSDRQRWQRLH